MALEGVKQLFVPEQLVKGAVFHKLLAKGIDKKTELGTLHVNRYEIDIPTFGTVDLFVNTNAKVKSLSPKFKTNIVLIHPSIVVGTNYQPRDDGELKTSIKYELFADGFTLAEGSTN